MPGVTGCYKSTALIVSLQNGISWTLTPLWKLAVLLQPYTTQVLVMFSALEENIKARLNIKAKNTFLKHPGVFSSPLHSIHLTLDQ